MNRRAFIAATAAAVIGSRFSFARDRDEHRIQKIGLELYTVRGALDQDFPGTLARVAKVGYKEVELAQFFAHLPELNPSAKRAREILDANGLVSPATHIPYTALSPENLPRVIEASTVLGHTYIVNPSIDRELAKQPDGWKRAAEAFNRAGEATKKAGIQLGYHNHVEEFKPLADGKLPYDVLLEETDPKLVAMEMDLGWAHEAGADPLAYFAKYPGRFHLVHVKDFTHDRTMTDVGKGEIDWKAIFSKAKVAGIEHYFVEFDNPGDPFGTIEASYAYLEKLRF
ncbi:MAG: sugar phosphate isomerase/epimerase [Acidobacteria bacterium]|nr:sugar phosphate isomerase/epimerase [Acidobacteriota bacterium]